MALDVIDARNIVIQALEAEFEGFDSYAFTPDVFTNSGGEATTPPENHDAFVFPWSVRLTETTTAEPVWRDLDTRGRTVEVRGVSMIARDAAAAADVVHYYDSADVSTQLGRPVQGRQFAPP